MSATSAFSASKKRAPNPTRSPSAATPETLRARRIAGAGPARRKGSRGDRAPRRRLSRTAPARRDFHRNHPSSWPCAVQIRLQGDRRCCCLIVMAPKRTSGSGPKLSARPKPNSCSRHSAPSPNSPLVDSDLRLAALLEHDRALEEVAPFFDRLDLIVIHFPSAADGRGFSTARQLRQAGFQGTSCAPSGR